MESKAKVNISFEVTSSIPLAGTQNQGRAGVILMVGATGNGKSTLGNFLTDPHSFRDPAKINDSKHGHYTVLDTPGLQEPDPKEDLAHMVSIFEAVKKAGHVAGVVLCLKYNNKLDGPVKGLLAYYAKVFGAVMLSNMVLVLTHFTEDAQADDERDEQGFVLEPILTNLRRELKSLLGGECGPIVTIDAFPSRYRPEAVASSLRRRAEILELISNMPQVPFYKLRLAKPPAWVEEDNQKIAGIEGLITGYSKRLGEVEPKLAAAAFDLVDAEKKIMELKMTAERIDEELRKLDTCDYIMAKSESVSKSWGFLHSKESKLTLDSDHEIIYHSVFREKDETWTLDSSTKYRISGTIKSRWMSGTSVHVTAYTHSKIAYADRIRDLKRRASDTAQSLSALETNVQLDAELQQLKDEIATHEATLLALNKQYVTLEEARARLSA